MSCTCYFMRAVIGCVICVTLSAVALAQDAPKADDKQISKLISKLGDKDFRTRDQAQKDLIAAGLPARPAVEAALGSSDLEIAQRARLVLTGIARDCFDAASKKAQDNILWSFPIKSGMVGSPLVKDGIAYVASVDRTIYAVDLKTGQKKWSQAKDLPGDDTNPISQMATSDACVVIALADGMLAGLEFASGKVLWKREPQNGANGNVNGGVNGPQMARMQVMRLRFGGGNAPVLPMTAEGSAIYLIEGSQIVILHAKNGEKKSVIDLPNSTVPVSNLHIEGGRIIFQSSDQQYHCYTLSDLKDTWQAGIKLANLNILVNDGKVYFVGPTTTTVADLATSKQLWNCQADTAVNPGYYPYGRPSDCLKIMDGLLHQFDGSRLAVVDLKETKYKSCKAIDYWHDAQEDEPQNQGNADGRAVMMRNAIAMMVVNGRVVPMSQGAGTTSAAIIEGMTAYVGAPYGLYAIGLSEGVPLWRLKGAKLCGAPAAQDGVLYFGTIDEAATAAAAAGVGVAVAVGGVPAAATTDQPASAPAADGKVKLQPGLHALKIK